MAVRGGGGCRMRDPDEQQNRSTHVRGGREDGVLMADSSDPKEYRE